MAIIEKHFTNGVAIKHIFFNGVKVLREDLKKDDKYITVFYNGVAMVTNVLMKYLADSSVSKALIKSINNYYPNYSVSKALIKSISHYYPNYSVNKALIKSINSYYPNYSVNKAKITNIVYTP